MGPDGMALDVEGNVFVAHSTLGTVYVHQPNGEPLAQIMSNKGSGTTNLTWGLKDKKVLYITESETGAILKIDWHCEGWLGE
jgi:gluconolactonase